jgi:hypothetical protein
MIENAQPYLRSSAWGRWRTWRPTPGSPAATAAHQWQGRAGSTAPCSRNRPTPRSSAPAQIVPPALLAWPHTYTHHRATPPSEDTPDQPHRRQRARGRAQAKRRADLPSWPCGFYSRHRLHASPQVIPAVSPSGEALKEPPDRPFERFHDPCFPLRGSRMGHALDVKSPGETLLESPATSPRPSWVTETWRRAPTALGDGVCPALPTEPGVGVRLSGSRSNPLQGFACEHR